MVRRPLVQWANGHAFVLMLMPESWQAGTHTMHTTCSLPCQSMSLIKVIVGVLWYKTANQHVEHL
jgi:hypothetical protein